MSNYNAVLNNLETLKLDKMRSFLPGYLDAISGKDVSVADALLELTSKELEFQHERASKIQIHVAGFPFEKTLKDFDFDFQPSINKAQIHDLATLRFMENKENILFYGSPGVGKSHLSVALGMEAASRRHITYFISCHDLITQLHNASAENRLEAKLKHYAKYKLLIIDEIGFLPIDKQGANLFFQLIAKRYEKFSTIITTNQPFSKWAEVFSDSTLANAILDRLLHHSHIIKITGPSYRLRDKMDAVEAKSKSA